jgi:hypothetical protein
VSKLDLTLPSHREAMHDVCDYAVRESLDEAPSHTPEHALAKRTLSTPALAAESLRGSVEALGVRVLNFVEASSFAFASVEATAFGIRFEVVHYPTAGRESRGTIALIALPALFLALLAIPEDAPDRRERALAALREHGR